MLVLSRKVGEQIRIDTDVTVTVVAIKGNRITLGIDAPKHVKIQRAELIVETESAAKVFSKTRLIETAVRDGLGTSVAG
jgi:carbon storage regulator